MKKIFTQLLLASMLSAGCTTPHINMTQEPFSFGIMADVQYADKANSGPRYYNSSVDRLETCVNELNLHDLIFTIQLGDIVDGNSTLQKTKSDLDQVLAVYETLEMPAFHVVGNHCLSAGSTLLKKLQLDRSYYEFTFPKANGWRFVVLNSNDDGIGQVSLKQQNWLQKTLKKAQNRKEKVLIFSHHPLLKEAAPRDQMKNAEDVLTIIQEFPCVIAFFAGHDHGGGYALHEGIHHVTLRGIVEAPEQNAFAIITITPDGIEKKGFGKEPDQTMLFSSPSAEIE